MPFFDGGCIIKKCTIFHTTKDKNQYLESGLSICGYKAISLTSVSVSDLNFNKAKNTKQYGFWCLSFGALNG